MNLTTTTKIISASILAADLLNLEQEVTAILAAGADWIHLDVMDQHFVPNLAFGPMWCQALRSAGILAPLDVHLMTEPVDQLILEFAKAGADLLTIHPESTKHLAKSLDSIRSAGCLAGLALKPDTPIEIITPIYELLDFMVIMAVNPGFAGQQFIANSYPRILAIKAVCEQVGKPIPLAIDGGVNLDNLSKLSKHGINIFIMGSGLFKHKNIKDYANTIRNARHLI